VPSFCTWPTRNCVTKAAKNWLKTARKSSVHCAFYFLNYFVLILIYFHFFPLLDCSHTKAEGRWINCHRMTLMSGKKRWEMQENSAKFDKQFFVYVPTTAQIPKTMKENRTSQISQRRWSSVARNTKIYVPENANFEEMYSAPQNRVW